MFVYVDICVKCTCIYIYIYVYIYLYNLRVLIYISTQDAITSEKLNMERYSFFKSDK